MTTPAPRNDREQLNEETIVDAAIQLAAKAGIERLTMRSLGDSLGMSAMAVYHYVPNKSVLLQLLANKLIEPVDPPRAGVAPWDRQLADLARALRSALRAYPGVGAFLLGSDVPTPAMDRITVASIDMLVGSGFHRKEAALAFTALHNFLLGRLRVEDAFGKRRRSARGRLGPQGTPPEVQAPADEHFEYGLAALLAGIRAVHDQSPTY